MRDDAFHRPGPGLDGLIGCSCRGLPLTADAAGAQPSPAATGTSQLSERRTCGLRTPRQSRRAPHRDGGRLTGHRLCSGTRRAARGCTCAVARRPAAEPPGTFRATRSSPAALLPAIIPSKRAAPCSPLLSPGVFHAENAPGRAVWLKKKCELRPADGDADAESPAANVPSPQPADARGGLIAHVPTAPARGRTVLHLGERGQAPARARREGYQRPRLVNEPARSSRRASRGRRRETRSNRQNPPQVAGAARQVHAPFLTDRTDPATRNVVKATRRV
ncbi:hypothetical protein PVAP13_1NG425019 [Panicum virgatum]|uniref:Uncharacterized protein n=1 Tax=Panicum virgatum TaxID=38727 RepID=A0A8T0X345_PANVG|nr:hypothetical protein PVAP13_1NG425019 [Panicum virgatum]